MKILVASIVLIIRNTLGFMWYKSVSYSNATVTRVQMYLRFYQKWSILYGKLKITNLLTLEKKCIRVGRKIRVGRETWNRHIFFWPHQIYVTRFQIINRDFYFCVIWVKPITIFKFYICKYMYIYHQGWQTALVSHLDNIF